MGRPFYEEILLLPDTHTWASSVCVDALSDEIDRLSNKPLVCVGSGGSLSTATVASTLFRQTSTQISFAATPLSMYSMRQSLRNASVFIATAGGSNPDVIGALKTAAKCEANKVFAICAKKGTKLSAEAAKYSNVAVHEFPIPSGSDGFLATNSLWASSVILARAFSKAHNLKLKLPSSLAKMLRKSTWESFVNSIVNESKKLWERETVVVLYGPSSHAAAIDLESKLSEAALSNIWIADYRHFAHGRHHWLAKRGASSSVVAFIEPSELVLAERTLQELPNDIPQLRIDLSKSTCPMLFALAHVYPLTKSAGDASNIDPGRPGVPVFGRKIYHLNAFGKMTKPNGGFDELEAVAIERKTSTSLSQLSQRKSLNLWRKAYDKFITNICNVPFGGIVFDYDGTLCAASERFTGVRDAISIEMQKLLSSGIRIGIATGRGRSVRVELQKCIPRKYWGKIFVGYYNGGQISTLKDGECPDGSHGVIPEFQPVLECLRGTKRLLKLADIEGRQRQITISAKNRAEAEDCWQLANHVLRVGDHKDVQFVRSSHSFDVLPGSVSKLAVVRQMEKETPQSTILTIGDMGKWPGNDFQLLNHPHSLSVDRVSVAMDSCWNLASPGISGVEATLEYLSRLRCGKRGTAKLKLRHNARRVKK